MKKFYLGFLALLVAFNGPMAFAGQGSVSEVKKDQVLEQEKTQPDTGTTFGSITKSIVKNAALAYGAIWAGLIAHEMGHAVAAKAVGLKVNSINVGLPPYFPYILPDSSYLSVCDTFFVRSLIPNGGYCEVEPTSAPLKNLVIAAAGPVAGIAAAVLLVKALGKKHTVIKYCAGLTIVANLLQLNPSISGSDGRRMMRAWKNL